MYIYDIRKDFYTHFFFQVVYIPKTFYITLSNDYLTLKPFESY